MSSNSLKYRRVWLAIGYAMIAVVVYGSLVTKLPRSGMPYGDKLVHLLSYGALMWWFAQLYPPARRVVLAISFVAMGIALEYVQSYVSRYRIFDIGDMLANSGGVVIGWLLVKTPLAYTILRVERWLPSTD